MLQSSFFDLQDRHRKLNEKDPLRFLNEVIDWESFRPTLNVIRQKARKSSAGRKPYDVMMMFKVLILQHLYNISDDEVEFQIRDRYSFCRFLELLPEQSVPDAKTIWLFRESLTKHDLIKSLFEDFEYQLCERGYSARKGQIVDASFVDVPKQRNTKEENQQIKNGEVPDRIESSACCKAQKDLDARWTKKNQETHFGYKNHVSVDNAHKFIREYEVTSAEVHDSNVFIDILAPNSSQDVWADSAYRSESTEELLKSLGYRSHVNSKGKRGKPLTDRQRQANRNRSRTRARVEHVFGSIQNEQGGLFSRVIGKARNAAKIGMMNLVYNIRRFASLHRTRTCS